MILMIRRTKLHAHVISFAHRRAAIAWPVRHPHRTAPVTCTPGHWPLILFLKRRCNRGIVPRLVRLAHNHEFGRILSGARKPPESSSYGRPPRSSMPRQRRRPASPRDWGGVRTRFGDGPPGGVARSGHKLYCYPPVRWDRRTMLQSRHRTSLGVTGCHKEIAKDRDNVARMSRDVASRKKNVEISWRVAQDR